LQQDPPVIENEDQQQLKLLSRHGSPRVSVSKLNKASAQGLMTTANPKEKFYGPLKQVAAQYVPLLMARMKVLESRAIEATEFLDADEETEVERVEAVVAAQSKLHKAVLEAGMCQSLVGAFADLLESDYQKIRDSSCFFMNEFGEFESLYEND
jgi:hypothetical protein